MNVEKDLLEMAQHVKVSFSKAHGMGLVHCLSLRAVDHELWDVLLFVNLELFCPNLTAPDNGTLAESGYGLFDNATFSCDDGFLLNGSSVLQCQINRQWDGEEPLCIGKLNCFSKIFLQTKNSGHTTQPHVLNCFVCILFNVPG